MNVRAQLLRATKPARYAIDEMLYRMSGESRKIAMLKDRYRGKPLLIVGNGPSLNHTPLDAFSSIASIGMNKIDMIFPRVAWRPSMILCINPMVVRQHAAQFADSNIPVYLSWHSRFMLGSHRKASSIAFFGSSIKGGFSFDVSQRVDSLATVTYSAFQFAYYMGADPVIIVGVDHNFDKTGDHVYERRQGPDVNHFDPNYFATGTLWGLPDLDGSEIAYARTREAFEQDGRRIVDATVGGKLQIFEKISIEKAIALAMASKQEAVARGAKAR